MILSDKEYNSILIEEADVQYTSIILAYKVYQ